jgi:hypothetical protein
MAKGESPLQLSHGWRAPGRNEKARGEKTRKKWIIQELGIGGPDSFMISLKFTPEWVTLKRPLRDYENAPQHRRGASFPCG